ncbi:hypothetical protein NMA58_16385 [Rhizobium sp. YTUHZ045]|uniref:hypothetical protein n=1 Tax=Rhizobium sp. YTUHZ045 TaxID=2962888 RepID=UPI003DA8884A
MGLFAFLDLGNSATAHQFLDDRRLFEEGRVPLAAGKRQDRREIAPQHDRQFITIRHQFDPLNERAKHLGGSPPCLLIAKLVVKGCDLVVVIFCEVGMQQGRRFVSFIENASQLLLSCFELAATLLEHLHGHRVLEI